MHLPSRESAFAVATARDLHNRIQWPQCAPHYGKIHVNTGFDKLRGNDAARLASAQKPTDFMDEVEPVLRAHGRGKMDRLLVVGQSAL
jgi:hypothetical protein